MAAASASYKISSNGFSGWINMKMGGKNMTMHEIQTGRRIGVCD